MEIMYKTLDGKIFHEEAEAKAHEQEILEQVKMWDFNDNPTTRTDFARIVHLIGEGAGAIFKAMVATNPEECVDIPDDIIDDEDHGWFYWDEYEDRYRHIDSAVVDALIAANHQI